MLVGIEVRHLKLFCRHDFMLKRFVPITISGVNFSLDKPSIDFLLVILISSINVIVDNIAFNLECDLCMLVKAQVLLTLHTTYGCLGSDIAQSQFYESICYVWIRSLFLLEDTPRFVGH